MNGDLNYNKRCLDADEQRRQAKSKRQGEVYLAKMSTCGTEAKAELDGRQAGAARAQGQGKGSSAPG
jgi:hypothetical protein